MVSMSNPLEWIAAVSPAAIIAAIIAGRTEATARWQARVERLRTDRARQENELHRQRFEEVWNWQRDQPAGEERVKSARWYGEWTGTDRPYRGGLDPKPLTPGLHSGDVDNAYNDYLAFLSAVYEPGRLGRPRPLLANPARRSVPGNRRRMLPGRRGQLPGGATGQP